MMGDHWPRMTSLTWNCNFYLGQDDLTWPSYRITVSRWWWWSYLCLYHVAPVSLPPTVVCQCVSNIITSRLLALCMLMSWTNHPVVLLLLWRQRARERERERDVWCSWNCKYQPWAPRPFQHPQVSFTVTKRASNGPVLTWLLRRYPSYHPPLLCSPHQYLQSHLSLSATRKILARQIIFTRNLLDCGKSLRTDLLL